ncbi:hypothetical protein WJX73_010575 [Symbiochloris irregularis]|uniref:Nuclear pore protein n=1 Tax=Symbiochloris irregularis TaxID=706552 RepID=A0AAW1PW35_9CHLO
MATMDWDELLQTSKDLAARDTDGFPVLQRGLQQVEHLSQKLKSKGRRLDASADSLAAARLFAQEGLSSQKISRELQAFELRPSYVDVAHAGTGSLEEYLQQLHEMSMINTIKEAQRHSEASFEDFMAQCRQQEWAAAKREMFGVGTGAGPISIPRSPNALRSPGSTQQQQQQSGQGQAPTNVEQQLSALEKAYLDVVQHLNAAVAKGESLDAASEFAAASTSALQNQQGQSRATMPAVWGVLVRMLAEASGGGRPTSVALLRGARKYLERGFVDHINSIVHANRAHAALGGAPTRRSQVRAYLRIRESARAPLDFDSAGGADTLWQRIFLCLRCGFHQEALEEARPLVRDVGGHGGSFEGLVREWVGRDGHLTGTSATIMASECVRLLGSADAASARAPAFQYKLLVYTLLSGNRITAEQVMQVAIQQSLLPTIEDFLWFAIALVQPPPAPSGFDAGVSSSGRGDAYQLADLQDHICRYPPEHYAAGGREPLLYAIVLLLTVQLHACIAFLAKHPSATAYRTDAVHLLIALLHHEIWDAGGAKDQTSSPGMDPAVLLQRYGQSFAATAPQIALEYYMLAAQAAQGTPEAKARLLKDLLSESNAFGFLLGSGGGAGALDRLLPEARERSRVLGMVAQECQASGQVDWAIELYQASGQAASALHIVCHQLAMLIPASLDPDRSERAEGELQQVLVRGAGLAAELQVTINSAAVAETEAFATLKNLRRLLVADRMKNYGEAVSALAELTFLPQEQFRVRRCVEGVARLHSAVASLLTPAVAAGGRALAAQGQTVALRALASFAADLPQRISSATLRELNHLQSELS